MAARKKKTFEEELLELETLVEGMEEGNLPLEQSLKAYEQGMELYASLMDQLKSAKARIEALQQGKAMPFEVEHDAE